MKIYIAGAYKRRLEFLPIKERLENVGHEVTSSWLSGEHDNIPEREAAEIDLDDIQRCCAVLLISQNGKPTTNGGRHFEFGYAYTLGKQLLLLGQREGVFHYLPEVRQYNNIEDLLANL